MVVYEVIGNDNEGFTNKRFQKVSLEVKEGVNIFTKEKDWEEISNKGFKNIVFEGGYIGIITIIIKFTKAILVV